MTIPPRRACVAGRGHHRGRRYHRPLLYIHADRHGREWLCAPAVCCVLSRPPWMRIRDALASLR